MPSLILVRGLPGSGKSTYAKTFFKFIHLEADMYHMNAKGVYDWKPENVHLAHEWCQKTAKILLINGNDVIVSNTFTKLSEMQFYMNLRDEIPYLNFSVYRCTNDFGNIHNVPDDVLEKMKNRFEDYIPENNYSTKSWLDAHPEVENY